MFPSTSSRETSGLEGKQNELFPSGPYIKCILYSKVGGIYKHFIDQSTVQKHECALIACKDFVR